MQIEVWLYGPLARYVEEDNNIAAQKLIELPEGSTVQALLDKVGMPGEARGITFINGDLSAMPGLQPDLDHALSDGDRVAFFHQKSMWPFQYRHDVAMLDEFKRSMDEREDRGLRSRYDK
ncbi:MAG: MoaD/ThiS family protein [Anaerolineae bacterium]